jgi:hypothetical protein
MRGVLEATGKPGAGSPSALSPTGSSGDRGFIAPTGGFVLSWLLPRGARCGTLMLTPAFQGVMPMARVEWLVPLPNAASQTAEVTSASSDRSVPVRAGEIGPIRREIIFEPVHEQPAPVEPAPVTPETEPKEPTPSRP